MDWFRELAPIFEHINKDDDERLVEGIKEAIDALIDLISKKEQESGEKINPQIKEFMYGTYVDRDKLVRRGYRDYGSTPKRGTYWEQVRATEKAVQEEEQREKEERDRRAKEIIEPW